MDRPWSEIMGALDRKCGRRFPAVVGGGRGVPLPIARILTRLRPEEVPRPTPLVVLNAEILGVSAERTYWRESGGAVDSGLWGPMP